ncbi:MAG: chemotaxis protein CheW [Planctomycetota bacterium]|nr:chemotaxis protein CheW [Planctomycetota bacterium]
MPSQYCTFWLGDLLFGIPVEHVQEVIMPQSMTPIPLVSESIRGLMNLRGQIIAVIDLRRCLALQDDSPMVRLKSVNVIVRTQAPESEGGA